MFLPLALFFISLFIRLIFLNFQSYDYTHAIAGWISFIKSNGYFYALKHPFSNYSPPYLYILTLLSYLPWSSLYSIKAVSISFDYVLAFFVMKIVQEKYKSRFISSISFFSVLFVPTVILDSAVWGQSDSIYASGIVAMLYFLIKKKYNFALFSFSLALAVKLQAIFLFPLLILFLLKEKKVGKYFLLIPLTYIVLILPALTMGRSLIDLLMIYWQLQINNEYGLDKLTQNAPNLYQWIPNELAFIITPISLVCAFSLIILFIIFINRKLKSFSKEITVKIAFIFSLVVPFILPRMHERYFFLADIFSLIYAFYFPRYFFVPLVVIAVSTLTYLNFLIDIQINLAALASILLIMIFFVLSDLRKSFK